MAGEHRWYVVVTGGMEKDYEPVHPGRVTKAGAEQLRDQHAALGIHVEVWSADQWDRYDALIRDEMGED